MAAMIAAGYLSKTEGVEMTSVPSEASDGVYLWANDSQYWQDAYSGLTADEAPEDPGAWGTYNGTQVAADSAYARIATALPVYASFLCRMIAIP